MAARDSLPSSSAIRFPDWQREYESALLETDRNALFERVEAAEAAVLTRRDALTQGPGDEEEQRAIEDALSNLRVLKREQLQFSCAPVRAVPIRAVPRLKLD